MHIRKFDFDFSRRHFMKQMATGVISTGVLAPLWATIAKGNTLEKVYPDEISSLEMITKGKINTGDVISAANVEHVKDLLDPIAYLEVSQQGREIDTIPTTTNPEWLAPTDYMAASIRNSGRGIFDATGNVRTDDGTPWIGGNPFPDAKSATEALANLTLSWGRYDHTYYAIREQDLNPNGSVAYDYDFVWAEMQGTGRITMEDRNFRGKTDTLRYQSIFFTRPQDIKGTAFLSVWPYDQNEFPSLNGYLPAFKRVRRFPTNQRFEPLIPGPTWYISDAWAAGDPFLTWGNFKLVYRGPMLGTGATGNFGGDHPNWERPKVGGAEGKSFFRTSYELIPDVIVLDAEPIKYPRAPISKRRVYIDARSMQGWNGINYDRRGEAYRSFEQGNGMSIGKDGVAVNALNGKSPLWTWNHVISHDIQTNRISLIQLVDEVKGGHKTHYNNPEDYDRFLTVSAMRRLGS
ncbi:MAG: DUF1329 domain-containing protein [bacterium]|jgi:hypothetical protein|nr:DUF1329 domain-containing protein [Gammaproteobacteria bacterium]HIL84376.1 DUF1329 domain-containing protein [Pseudomonadales bacterium]